MNTRNAFSRTDRGLRHYERLKDHLNNRANDILISLPLFVRIVLTDRASPWYNEFNKYDLLNPIFVHSAFPSPWQISDGIECALLVCPTPMNVKGISVYDFLSTRLIQLRGTDFSVQEFISAVAYNGGLHNEPDKKPELRTLYTDFIELFHETAFKLTLDIASCFVESFHEVYNKFCGDNNAFSPEHHRQPQIVEKGKVIVDEAGQPMTFFSDAYMQLPIRQQLHKGLRICLELQLCQGTEGCLFSYGHRQKSKVTMTCRVVPNYILVSTSSHYPALRKIMKLPILHEYSQKRFWLEVAMYNSRRIVVSINEWLKDNQSIPHNFSIENGKLIVGADLDGNHSARFYADALIIEEIDKHNKTKGIFSSVLRRLSPCKSVILPPDALERTINTD